ncbi:MAG TPA: pentapeptide repeat-containing protein, partial [Terriglobia bacterium]|nr:pentapeptide repeat-containing protein [Terriglobia bacterium]
SKAILRGANLMNASLRRSTLQGADLSGATLYGSDFRKADLRGANLRDGVVGEVGQALTFRALDVSFKTTNLAGAVFDGNTQLPFDVSEAASRKMVGMGVVSKSSTKSSSKDNPPKTKKTIKAVPIQIGPN